MNASTFRKVLAVSAITAPMGKKSVEQQRMVYAALGTIAESTFVDLRHRAGES